MTAVAVFAIVSPILPAILLVATIRGSWPVSVFGPAQFVAVAVEGLLAASNEEVLPQAFATVGFAIAMAGLIAVVFGERWVERRILRSVRWEDFEREFWAYAEGAR